MSHFNNFRAARVTSLLLLLLCVAAVSAAGRVSTSEKRAYDANRLAFLNHNLPRKADADVCPAGTTDCQDTCCQNTDSPGSPAETCCPDPKNGGVCCIEENTFCCPPNPNLDQPSRCCPRWYVCCTEGQYGCCDPDTMAPMEANLAIAILEETSIWTDESALFALSIDLGSGNYTQQQLKPGFHTDQEITRKFMFAPESGIFYMLQANFTQPPANGGDPQRQIKLYAINPATLATTVKIVSGAVDEVTGFKYIPESRTIVMATKKYNASAPSSAATHIGYNFYHLNVDTAVATLVSEYINALSEESWTGWFHEVSADMKFVYRLGFRDVVNSIDFGLGIVNITSRRAVFLPWVSVPMPLNHLNFQSIHFYPGRTPDGAFESAPQSPVFISLAPGTNFTNPNNLGAFMWAVANPSVAKQLAHWPNAHVPPYFGPIAEGLNAKRTKYAAVVSANSPLGDSYDEWTIATLDLVTGNATQVALSPVQLSSTGSISGFGIPYSSSIWHGAYTKKK